MKFVKVTTIPNHLAPSSIEPRRQESFEEWQARVCALDDAVREHLAPKRTQDWRYIDIPDMLQGWKSKRCESNYLNLVERLMRMLEIFACTGTMSPSVVEAQLEACETFLGAQDPILAREKTLCVLAGQAKKRLSKHRSPKGKAA